MKSIRPGSKTYEKVAKCVYAGNTIGKDAGAFATKIEITKRFRAEKEAHADRGNTKNSQKLKETVAKLLAEKI